MRIVGIDPGTNRIGYALLDGTGIAPRLIAAETITIAGRQHPGSRLDLLAQALTERLDRDRPHGVAIEKIFFSKNAKTALAVAEARGVILLTAWRHVPSIWEYAPLEVKMAIAGYGRLDKAAVRRAVAALLPDARLPAGDDAIDAIAIALTALATERFSA